MVVVAAVLVVAADAGNANRPATMVAVTAAPALSATSLPAKPAEFIGNVAPFQVEETAQRRLPPRHELRRAPRQSLGKASLLNHKERDTSTDSLQPGIFAFLVNAQRPGDSIENV